MNYIASYNLLRISAASIQLKKPSGGPKGLRFFQRLRLKKEPPSAGKKRCYRSVSFGRHGGVPDIDE
jgi:hypothetical protein